MKNLYKTLIFSLFCAVSYAQSGISIFAPISNISNIGIPDSTRNFLQTLSSAQVVQLDLNKNTQLVNNSNTTVVEIPTKNHQTILVELIPTNILSPDFKVMTPQGEIQVELPTFYKGRILGEDKSYVAITITKNSIEGIIASTNYNYTIGRIKNQSTNLHVIYETYQIRNTTNVCPTGPVEVAASSHNQNQGAVPFGRNNRIKSVSGCRSVDVYMEADYKTYTDFGSNTTNVTNYITSLFNNVSQLYANEGVNLLISTIFIWTTTDPYASLTSTSDILYAFDDNITYTGDIAHLISTRGLGGGIAYLSGGTSVYGGMTQRAVFQTCGKTNTHGVSGSLSTTIVNIPTYSWNVEVVAHEIGHNFGLPHTHSCTWPGGAIDNCGPTAGYTEGSCTPPAIPTGTGTVMSYCHLTSTGINFLYGFGTMPGDKMRAEVAAATCLDGIVTAKPTVTDIAICSSQSVTLNASGCSGTYTWYNVENGGTSIATGSSYTTPIINTTTYYYVECTANGCTSDRTRATVAAFNSNLAPITTNGAGCSPPTTVTLSASGCSVGATYRWWNAATGGTQVGTGTSFITPPISTTTPYYVDCFVTGCTPTARVVATATITGLCPVCTPLSQNCTSYNDYISLVKIFKDSNVLLNNATTCSGSSGYSYTATPVISLKKDSTYSLTVANLGTYPYGASAWIDYNQNNILEAGEKILTKTSSTWASYTITFTVPSTASLGNARLRVRLAYSAEPTDPCTNVSSWGETEDYLVNIINPCPTTLVYGTGPQAAGTYKAVVSIDSQATVATSTIYQAGNYVLLKEGFIANNGVTFTAQIGGCN